jgi:hypothetical protein
VPLRRADRLAARREQIGAADVKSLAILAFVFLVMPGSGRLVWDGLPLSTRAEFATLVVIVLAILNREVRGAIQKHLYRWKWRGAVKPLLGLLILLKLLTFSWQPFSDGFIACYRSLYYPLVDPERCEKSYESPFTHHGFVIDNSSRVDRTIDFGTHMHDWSLPFMNEYPRLGTQWLQRFPFQAEYGAVFINDATEYRYLPIYGNGEIEGTFGSAVFGTTGLNLADRYEFPRVTVVQVPPGRSEFTLKYRFADDEASVPPDEAPPVRGPYALLKVGEPKSRVELMESLQIRIRGWAVDITREQTPSKVIARDALGAEVGHSLPQARPDVAGFIGKPTLEMGGFNLTIPAGLLERGDVTIEAVYDDRGVIIGRVEKLPDSLPSLPTINMVAADGHRSEVTLWFDAERNDFAALAPANGREMGILFNVLVVLLDLASAVLVGGLLIDLLRALGQCLLPAFGLAAAAFGLTALVDRINPNMFGPQLWLPIGILTVLVVLVARQLKVHPIVTYLPTSVVLAIHTSFSHLERFHGSKGERWWGRLLFYWRDSDWYTTQGFARTIFIESSLRGGEALFWFQSGPRYLALATRILLGENDVLVGIIMTSLGFFAVMVLVVRFLATHQKLSAVAIGGIVLFVVLLFMSDDLMASFGFVGSSEYPTWIALFLVTGFVIATRRESRAWLLVAISLVLGYSIQLRPNQIGGIFMLFVVLLILVDRSDTTQAISTIGKMTVAFATVTSFSLWHNLHYGESFVLFTANAGINYAFSWREVFGLDPGGSTWAIVLYQVRYMMYWRVPNNGAWALAFWGSQLLWLCLVAARIRRGLALRVRSLLLLIPFGYALPMLKFQMGSYYPRHLVVINLSFMCAALMAWPRSDEFSDRNIRAEPEAAELANSDDSTPVAAPAPDPMVSAVSR